jgi:hypothetical protein
MKLLTAGSLSLLLSFSPGALAQDQTPPATSPAPAVESPAPVVENPAPAVDAKTTPGQSPETAADTDVALISPDGGSIPWSTVTGPYPPTPKGTYQTNIIGDRPDPNLIGASATTVTRQTIESLPGGDNTPVTNLVAMQPGLVQDSFGSNIHFRGNDGAVLYVLDGIPLLSAPVGTVGQLLNIIPTRLVQNMQVFQGGFPVEYSFSLGGVIDIRTRKGTVDPYADVQLTYGTYNTADVAATYSQQFGQLGVVASVDFLTTQRGLDTPDAVPVVNDLRTGGNAFAKLTYELDARDRFELVGIYEQDKFHIPIDPTMLPLSDAPPGSVRGNDVYGDPSPQFVPYSATPTDFERTFFVGASYVHTGEVGTQLSLYAREIYEDFNCDPTGSLGATADPGATCSDFTRDIFHFGLVGNITWQWLPGNSWKAGVQFDDAPSTLTTSVFTRDDASPSGGADPSATLSGSDAYNTITTGVYLEDRIEAGNLTLLPGVRFDLQNTTFGNGSTAPNIFLAGPSVRLGASYAFTDKWVAHAFIGYLFEVPTVFDAPVIAPALNPSLAGQDLPNNLKGATTYSAEVGLTWHPLYRFSVGVDVWGRIMRDWLDHQNIENSNLWAAFNWENGNAVGGDLYFTGEITRFSTGRFILDGFGNLSVQYADQTNINSLQYLFPPEDISGSAVTTIQDHVQFWTANLGLMLHDADKMNNLAVFANYGSGFHIGINNNSQVPEHFVMNITASHTFDVPTKPTIAFDAFNLFNDIYAFRLGTGYFGNSQYAPLRRFDVRLIVHFG